MARVRKLAASRRKASSTFVGIEPIRSQVRLAQGLGREARQRAHGDATRLGLSHDLIHVNPDARRDVRGNVQAGRGWDRPPRGEVAMKRVDNSPMANRVFPCRLPDVPLGHLLEVFLFDHVGLRMGRGNGRDTAVGDHPFGMRLPPPLLLARFRELMYEGLG